MHKLVQRVKDKHKFDKEVQQARHREKELSHQLPPIFNKRFYSALDGVTITAEVRRIMGENGSYIKRNEISPLTKFETITMKSVIENLKNIHHDIDHIKTVLCHVVSYETYEPFTYITKQSSEEKLSCYYIIGGSVEVTYDLPTDSSLQIYEPNIIYTHGPGEYMGTVNYEDSSRDLEAPSTVYTREHCELLRVDRTLFHDLLARTEDSLMKDKLTFIEEGNSILSELSTDVRKRLAYVLIREEYPPNKTVLKQGEMAAYVSFILSGHCSCYRVVQLSKKERQTFQVGNLETGGFFGESCVVHEKPAEYCVQTECITICLKLKKSDYEILGKDNFIKLIEMNKLVVPPDGDLEKLLVDCEAWHVFRSQEVRHVFNRKSAKKRALRSANNSSHDIHGSATDGFIQLQMVYSHLYDVDNNNDEEQTGSCSRAVGAGSRSLPSISLTNESVHEKSAINLMTTTRGLSKSSSYFDDQKPGPGERFPDLDSYYKDMDRKLQILDTRALVTQARELADEYATRNTQKKTRPGVDNRERWYTVIHESNELAKIRIAWGKYRMEILRRRLKKEREIRFNSTSLEDRKRAQEATAQRRSADDQKVKDEVKDRQDQGRNNFIANKYKNRWKSKRRHLLESLTSGYGAQMCPGDGTTKKLFISPRLPSRTTSYGQMSPWNQDKASPRIKFSFDI